MSASTEALTKVLVDLPQHWAAGGESMWAKPLGDDLYRLENIPFHAYGLNFHDIVLALARGPDFKLVVESLHRASGQQ